MAEQPDRFARDEFGPALFSLRFGDGVPERSVCRFVKLYWNPGV